MVNTVQRVKSDTVVEVTYNDEKFNNIFFNSDTCETKDGLFLTIGHWVTNKNEEGKTIYMVTNIALSRIKNFKMFRSIEEYNGYYGIYPKPTWKNDGGIEVDWGSGKKYEIEINYLNTDKKPDRLRIVNVTNAVYTREAGLETLRFEYILKDGSTSQYSIGLNKLIEWKIIKEME